VQKWHPDKCSSSSISVKHMEEAKEKFQEIQGAYSGLNLPSLSTLPNN
jgi:DnaJ-class molecular chaperone